MERECSICSLCIKIHGEDSYGIRELKYEAQGKIHLNHIPRMLG